MESFGFFYGRGSENIVGNIVNRSANAERCACEHMPVVEDRRRRRRRHRGQDKVPPFASGTAAAPAAPPPAPATGQAAPAARAEQLGRERRIRGGWLLRAGGRMGVCLKSNGFTSKILGNIDWNQ